MRVCRQIITLTCLFVFVWSSVAYGYSYRQNRRHKGFKTQKTSHQIGEVKKRQRGVPGSSKRRPMQLSVFERFAQERMQEKTAEQIRDLQEIINSTPQDQRADYYFRLAEHFWENSKYYDFVAHKYDDYRGRPEWPEKAKLQQQSSATSKLYKRKAAQQYWVIIKQYPNYKNLCQAYYFLGKNLFEMGQEKTALQVFTTMISRFAREYPACPFIPNAYLAFGEHYFNTGAVRNALRSYEQVLHYRNSSIYGFALYKVAWCHYNLVSYDLSLRKFVEVVNHARQSVTSYSSQGRRIQLLREALRDLVLAYSQIGQAAEAKSQFLQIGGEEHYIQMLRNLGTLYRQQGKFSEAIVVYQDLMRLTPDTPNVLFYQLYITQGTDRVRSKEDTIRESGTLVKLVKTFRKRTGGGEIQKNAEVEIRDQLKEFAQFRHYEGQKTRSPAYFQDAIAFYRLYLSAYGTRKESYEMHFWLGELLFSLRRYEEAASEYTKTLLTDPKGKFSTDAGYNAILAYNKLMVERGMDVSDVRWKKTSSDINEQPLPPLAKEFLASCVRFLKHFPKGDRAIDVAYKAAQMYYRFNHLKEALSRFYFLVQNHPKHEYAMYSAHYILDTYNLKKEWANLNQWSWKFYRMAELGNTKFKGEVRSIIIQSGIKICGKIEKEQKKPCDAAKCFLKFANEFPDNKQLASLALYNASINEYKCQRPEQALALRRQLIERYPNSQFVKQSILDLADIYASQADFGKASEYYLMYAEKYPRDDKSNKARIQGALFAEALNDDEKAIRLYRQILGDRKWQSKEPEKFVSLYFRLTELIKKRGEWRQYSTMMDTFDKKRLGPFPMRLHARYEYAMALQRLGSRSQSERLLQGIPQAYDTMPTTDKQKYPQAGYAAAHVRFLEAEKLFVEYSKVNLNSQMSKGAMEKTLETKKKVLLKAFKAYELVAKYRQGEWGIAALYRAGDLFLNYSKFLLSAPVPSFRKDVISALRKVLSQRGVPWGLHSKVLNRPNFQQIIAKQVERATDNYKMKLQELSQPEEDRAANYYKLCLDRAHKLRIYNKWTTAALRQLQQIKPYEYPPVLETGWALQRAMSTSDFQFTRQMMREIRPSSPPPTSPGAEQKPAPSRETAKSEPPGEPLGLDRQ